MRDGNGVIFYWPVVLNPDGVMRPLPSGEIVNVEAISGFENKLVLAADRDNEMYNRTGKDGGFSNVVLDPRAIPVAMEKPHLDGVQYDRENVNRLEVKHFQGLFVGSYFDSNNIPLYNGPSSLHEETGAFKDLAQLVVTVRDLAENFVDCDGSPIFHADRFSGFTQVELATCANLQDMKRKIEELIKEVRHTLIEMRNELQQEIDSKFDGSNASTDIKEGLDNAGPSSSAQYEPKPMRVLAADCPRGGDSEETRYYAVAAGLTPNTTYAIDQFIDNPLGAQPTYLGTHYVLSNGSGQISRRVRHYHGGNFGDESRFVLRTLRADEAGRQGTGAPFEEKCSP